VARLKILTIVAGEMGTYPRGNIIYKGLKYQGKDIESYSVGSVLGYLELIKRLFKRDYDLLIINGILVLLLAKILSRKPIILDAFISHYDNLVNDRKIVGEGSPKARFLRFVDRWSCKVANKVILDTDTHIDYFVKEFKLNKDKFYKIPIGADDNVFVPKEKITQKEFFNIVFVGTFIPLQGIQYIIKAAKLLENENINFNIIGDGQTYQEMRRLHNKLAPRIVCFLGRKNPEGIIEFMKDADVCLGLFGDTEKTQKVIPNKVYEAIAMEKAVITSDTPGIREEFKHGENIYLCKVADEKSLAKAILELKNNPELKEKIAEGGYKLFKEKFTNKEIGRQMHNVIKNIF